MGKMILDDLRKRLERLDEDADLMIDNNDRYQMVIVGGSAFILLGKLTRATHDIDALSVPKELYSLLGKYDINTDVEAYIDNFPYNFQDRLQPLPFGGTKVQFYTPSGRFGDCKAVLFPGHRQSRRRERGRVELFGLGFAGTPCNG